MPLSQGFKGDYKTHLRGPGDGESILPEEDGFIMGLNPGSVYYLSIEEDPSVKVEHVSLNLTKKEKEIGDTSAMKNITAELKGLSPEELKARGEDYKRLLEARDLEDVLYNGQ